MFRPKVRPCAAMLVLALLFAAPQAARAGFVYENFGAGNSYDTTTGYTIGNFGPGANYVYAAAFTTSAGPLALSSISVALGEADGSTGGLVNISLASDIGGSPGAVLETLQAAVPGDYFSGGSVVTVNSASNPILQANTQYWVEVSAVSSSQYFGWFFNNQGARGPVGTSLDGGATYSVGPDTDGAFSVEANAAPVPEPSSIVLLCSGLGGALVWRRFGKPKR